MDFQRSQNYTNTVVGKDETQTFEVVIFMLLVLLLSFDVFVPKNAHPFFCLDKWLSQIYLNVSSDFHALSSMNS